MIKPMTYCFGLVAALGMSSLAFAGGGKSLPTPQGPVVSEQCLPSGQCALPTKDCSIFTKKTITIPKIDWCAIPKPKLNCNYTYTWVLKKKLCGPLITWEKGSKGAGCDACGPAGVYPTGQYASPQVTAAAPTYGSGQVYGAGQIHSEIAPAPAPAAEGVEAPVAPPTPDASAPATSMLFLPRGN
ncbi:MAG: hypothetical protein U0800_21580 [Isosphaeraceae bacterium]